jgi:hypothetical protein
VLYIEALAAPDTINTIPEETLRAVADHGHVTQTMPADGGAAEAVLAQFTRPAWTWRRSVISSSATVPGRLTTPSNLLASLASKSSPRSHAGRSAKNSS